ncbi:MAG TPA: pyrroline-5-carboxylate reductase [Planctomycetota bacterium]|nr:pyrroline-5-carboxylate reductase [Planctomycetota bacterium]
MASASSSATPAVLPAIAVIGGGNMATAIIKGLRALPTPPTLVVSEPDAQKRERFAADGVRAVADNRVACADARIVLLATKPQVAAQVLPELGQAWRADRVLVSILAGTPTRALEAGIGAAARPRVVRAMPNTPLAIGLGMVGLCRGAFADDGDLALAESLFAPCAKILRVADERRMDAVTAVSGSGPAYFFRFAEALVAGAMELGFSRDEAVLLISTTGAGSWRYLQESGFEAAKLREQVTSPGGTTAAALKVINDSGFDQIWSRALKAADERGRELGKLA